MEEKKEELNEGYKMSPEEFNKFRNSGRRHIIIRNCYICGKSHPNKNKFCSLECEKKYRRK